MLSQCDDLITSSCHAQARLCLEQCESGPAGEWRVGTSLSARHETTLPSVSAPWETVFSLLAGVCCRNHVVRTVNRPQSASQTTPTSEWMLLFPQKAVRCFPNDEPRITNYIKDLLIKKKGAFRMETWSSWRACRNSRSNTKIQRGNENVGEKHDGGSSTPPSTGGVKWTVLGGWASLEIYTTALYGHFIQ